MRTFAGTLQASGLRFGVVAARFNGLVTDRLLDGALRGLSEHGASESDIEVVRVPGSFEVPLAVRLLASSGRVHAVVALGAIIRGETPHHEHLASTVIRQLATVMCQHEVPVALGILTTDTVEQALARADHTAANKGYEAAVTAIEMATLRRTLIGLG